MWKRAGMTAWAAVLATAIGVAAQGPTVSGVVTDRHGQPLPGVAVSLDGPQGRQATVTAADGAYRFEAPSPGRYRVRFERAGFRSEQAEAAVVGAGDVRLDATLEVAFLQAVTVTAQRREQSLQDVPASITSADGTDLNGRGVSDVSGLSALVPGLNFARAGDDARPALRGARTENVSAVNDPVVGFYVDGVPRSRFSQALHPFVDLERVEVQRGPQGTLSGRNSFGGDVHLVSKAPGREFDYAANGTLGAFSQRRLDAFVNAPLGPRAELRVAGLTERRDGYVENTAAAPDIWDENLDHVRASLRVRPTDSLDLLGRFTHWDQAGNGQGDFGLVNIGTLRDPDTGLISLDGVLDPVSPRGGSLGAPRDTPYRLGRDIPLTRDNAENCGSLVAVWRAGDVRVESTTAYTRFSGLRQNDGDFSSNVHALEFLDERVETFSQEVQVASQGPGRLQWVVGVFRLDDELRYGFVFDRLTLAVDTDGDPETASAATDQPSPGLDVKNLETLETTSTALFGHASYEMTARLRASAGARWTGDRKTYSLLNELTGKYNLGFGGASVEGLRGSWNQLTWTAGLDYRVSPDHLVYGSVSTGFVAGGFAVLAPSLVYEPQRVTAWELGSKSQIGGKLRLNAAAYYSDYRDLLANAYGTLTGVFFVYQTNAGSVTSRGIELELEAEPVPRLSVHATLALQDSRYGEFVLPNPLPRGGDPSLPGNLVDLSDTRVQQQPWARIGIDVRYEVDLGRLGTLTPRASTYYSSEYSANDVVLGRDRVSVQGAYTKTDLRLAWTPWKRRLSVEAFVLNLEDEAVLRRLVRGGDNILQGGYAPPRTWGVTLSVWR